MQHNCVSADGRLYSTSYGCHPLGIVGEAGPQGERGEIGPQGPAGSPGAVVSVASVEDVPGAAPAPVGELALMGIGLVTFGVAFFGVRRFA